MAGGGNSTRIYAAAAAEESDSCPAMARNQQQLRQDAAVWVQQAAAQLSTAHPAAQVLPGSYQGTADSMGISPTQQLNTAAVSNSFFPAAFMEGITLYEPFGGLCAGLEMVLRNGIAVQRYLYSDTDAVAQRIAAHRIRQLQAAYPQLLGLAALAGAFTQLPADVKLVASQHLQTAVKQSPAKQWLVVAGWPCQDLSAAGPSRGMAGSRAQLLHDLVRIIGTLQQLQQHSPPAYLL